MKIKYFGTWAVLNKSVDTMHMKLFDATNELFIDTWWGMSLMQRVYNWHENINHLYMTHCHSDHLLGIAHVLRVIKNRPLHLYCTEDLEKRISSLMEIVWKWTYYAYQKDNWNIRITYIVEWTDIHIWNWTISPINLYSNKDEQYGLILKQEEKKLVFFGDEAVNILNRNDLDKYRWADRLLCESFCVQNDKLMKKPHEKQHVTAQEAGHIAQVLWAKHLILSHISDYTDDRQQQLIAIKKDAEQLFSWPIIVPQDNDTIELW